MALFNISDGIFILAAIALIAFSYVFILSRPPRKPDTLPAAPPPAPRRHERHERQANRQLEVEARRRAEEEELRRIAQRDEREAAAEALAAETAAKAEEERRKAEEAEYAKWKELIVVEEENAGNSPPEESNDLLKRFLDFLVERKVSEVSELARALNLQPKECVQRIRELESQNLLTGVLDDRGKYIHITAEEVASLSAFIERRGCLSKAELVAGFSERVRLEPSAAAQATIAAEEALLDAGLARELASLPPPT